MSQLLLRVLQWKERGDTLTNLAICYDSNYAASWGSTDDMLDTHVEAGILLPTDVASRIFARKLMLDYGVCRSLYVLPCRVDHTAGVDRIRYG